MTRRILTDYGRTVRDVLVVALLLAGCMAVPYLAGMAIEEPTHAARAGEE